MGRVTHIRRTFDDGVISSTDYENSQDAVDDNVYSAMGRSEALGAFQDPVTKNVTISSGSSYFDIEVIDQLTLETGSGFQYQKITRTFLWGDSWASQDPSWSMTDNDGASQVLRNLVGSNALSSDRQMLYKIVMTDADDNHSGIPVPILWVSRNTVGNGFQFQETVHTLATPHDTDNLQGKVVTPRRVIYSGPKEQQLGDDPDSGEKPCSVDVNVIDAFKRSGGSGFQWRGIILSPDNSSYYSQENVIYIPADAVSADGSFDPPWVLDPLQRIVNVVVDAIAVKFAVQKVHSRL
jgi:hypothetical protein